MLRFGKPFLSRFYAVARPGRFLAALTLSFSMAKPSALAEPAVDPRTFPDQIRPLLKEYCFPCHSSEKHKGDFDMEAFSSTLEVKRHPKVWQEVVDKLANNEMPPEEKPQPSAAQREAITNWVVAILGEVGREHAGDPGPVVLRRLSNAEYTYTVQDLTGVNSLQPAREFPVDGAAGEGFMNTGQALVMSPSLLAKYLDAGKEIAGHAVLLPDGLRFSPKNTRRDWTEELLAQIREFYSQFTDPHGGDKVNVQGIVFETNEGGRLPVEKYLAATLQEREAVLTGRKTAESVAREKGLSAKYFDALLTMLSSDDPSLLLDGLRGRWLKSKGDGAHELTAEIIQWQKTLWKFNTVGHIGKAGGPKSWMEPVNPLIAKQEVRLKIPTTQETNEVTLYLVASDAGDGNQNDFVQWVNPRLVAPGRADLLLRDVRDVSRELAERRERIFAATAKCLDAVVEAAGTKEKLDITQLAARFNVDIEAISAWSDYLGIGEGPLKIESHFTNKLNSVSNYDFIKGWGSSETPSLFANSSEQPVRIPGSMKPRSVAVHPSPTLQAAVGWESPIAATMQIEATITHAHPECGNGITWSLELRRGATRQRLAAGVAQGGNPVKAGPFNDISIQPGDLVSVLIGPRDGNHACDLTAVDLILSNNDDPKQTWNLATDVSSDILAGNPHADHFGNEKVWHFYTEPDNSGNGIGAVIPAGSLLAKWQSAPDGTARRKFAEELRKLLTSGPPATKDSPDAKLYRQLASLGGPLFASKSHPLTEGRVGTSVRPSNYSEWGLDRAAFGRHSDAAQTSNPARSDSTDLFVHAPSVIEIRLPADIASGCEFVTTGILDPELGAEGSVQLQVLTRKPEQDSGLFAGEVTQTQASGPWTSDNRRVVHATPILVNDGSRAKQRFETAFDDFRRWFPTALCYTKIVPVDEAVTLTLYYREDDQLARLMLDEAQKAKLDALWDQLHYVSQDALMLVDAFEQLWQYATQDADPKVFEPLRKPIQDRAAAFRERLLITQSKHLEAALQFARRAYRHPLSDSESDELRRLYQSLREKEIPHEEAVRLLLARVLVAPAFLYRAETPGPGTKQAPLNDWELASRLSYFLWSSMPDAELAQAAESGNLHRSKVLLAQTRRMLGDTRVRRLAIEFACQWLHIHDFDAFDEKSDRYFPTFAGLRSAMYEESIRFFSDLFQHNGSVLEILDADHTFLNEALAKYYGIEGVTGDEWRRVDGMKKFSRGGILGQAATLAKQSGASRTSPILRGNWVAEALLGDKLPKPPKDVPRLPEEEATESLTVRQLTEKHSTDPRCYHCHQRIDAFGYALEAFDAIGRRRDRDLADRLILTRARVMDGTEIEDIDGLRNYLLTKRREAFLHQFCRKLLGYALGRSVQLSDGPLLVRMREELEANHYQIRPLFETIVQSSQFREIRGRDAAYDE